MAPSTMSLCMCVANITHINAPFHSVVCDSLSNVIQNKILTAHNLHLFGLLQQWYTSRLEKLEDRPRKITINNIVKQSTSTAKFLFLKPVHSVLEVKQFSPGCLFLNNKFN